jgi:hypothetical protein
VWVVLVFLAKIPKALRKLFFKSRGIRSRRGDLGRPMVRRSKAFALLLQESNGTINGARPAQIEVYEQD